MSVTDYISSLPVTKASMTFDGIRLESSIPGFRVHTATGRDSMEQEVEEIESKIVDGAYYRSKRLPTRDIEVEFILIRENVEDLHEAYTKLKGILYSSENARIEFNDEPDVFYIGTVTNLTSENVVLQNDSKGTFTIHCSDPFKYGKTLIEVTPDTSDSTQFTITYDGTYKSFPIIEASFSDDCGYVGFTDGKGALQFGDPKEKDTGYETTNLNENIMQFSKGKMNTAWSSFTKNDANLIPLGIVQNATGINPEIKKNNVTTYDSKGKPVRTMNFDEYVFGMSIDQTKQGQGTASAIWCGVGFKRAFNADSGGVIGGKNFFALAQLTMDALKAGVNQTTSTETDPRQVGMIQFVVSDSSGSPILGMVFIKNNQSTSCEVRLYAGTTEITTGRIDGEKNKNMNVYANSKQNKYLFWDHGEFSMSKNGDTVDFYVDHQHHTFKASAVPAVKAIQNKVGYYVNFFIGRLDTTGVSGSTYGASYRPLREMYIRGVAALKYNTTVKKDIANKFMSNDLLEINTDEGTVKLNGILRDDLGAIGNEWDKFYLVPGINIVKIAKSGWARQPSCVLKYRKVFI